MQRAAVKLMDLRGWPQAETFWEQQARGVIRRVVEITPPAHAGVTGIKAKQHGERVVEGQIKMLFFPVQSGGKYSASEVHAIHTRARDNRGRVRRSGRNAEPVSTRVLNPYITKKKRRVGYMAAGWNRAAARVGYRPPAWVWRHQSEGGVTFRISRRGFRFKATNKVSYSARHRSEMERRIQYAVHYQTRALERQVKHLVERAARKSGFNRRRRRR